MNYVKLLRERPIAIETSTANEQHYEVGTSVLQGMLGARMKYSACLYEKGGETLAQAEIAMLRMYVERAELKDGMSILDLGYVHSFPTIHTCVLTSGANRKPDVDGAQHLCTSLKYSPTRKSPPSPTRGRKRSTLTLLPRPRDSPTLK